MNTSEPPHMPHHAYRPHNTSPGSNHHYGQHDTSRTYSPNVMNGVPFVGDSSPYSSRLSVQSVSSNQPWDRQPSKNATRSRDAPSPIVNNYTNDNYAHYLHNRSDQATPTRDMIYNAGPRGDDNPPDHAAPTTHHSPSHALMSQQNDSPYNNFYQQSPTLNTSLDNYPGHDRLQPGDYQDDPSSHGDYYHRNHYADNHYAIEDQRPPSPGDPYRHIEQSDRSLNAYEVRPDIDDSFRNSPLPEVNYHGDTGQPYRGSSDDIPISDSYYNSPSNRSLPAVDSDPFRDDPFHVRAHATQLNERDTPSPNTLHTGDQMVDNGYEDDDMSIQNSHPGIVHDPPQHPRYEEEFPQHYGQLGAPQPVHHDDSYPGSYRDDYSQHDENDGSLLRSPDLQEVIEYLTNQNDEIKANAAAYLAHLSFMDNDMKAKIRSMNGIRALVGLLSNEFPEVHRNACCALKNLSYGQANSENKTEIRNENGISHLVRLLRKTDDSEMLELVTAVLWNMSSLKDLKMAIIDEALTMIVAIVLIKHTGWERHKQTPSVDYTTIYWTTSLRNATGILRNLSSGDYQARKRLRECEALVTCVVHLVRMSLDQHTYNPQQNSIDNKCVENCVCVMRNLSYLCQETDEPNFRNERPVMVQKTQSPSKSARTGCFGGKRKDAQKLNRSDDSTHSKRMAWCPRDTSQLWHCTIVPVYKKLLMDCSNSVTLEAAVGAIQNVAACYWQPSIDFRESIRREKCLPIIVELLAVDSDPVVCAAITALRNLTVDERNMELIGKYAMQALVSKLPLKVSRSMPQDHVVQAALSTLLEVIKKNCNYAVPVLNERGVERLRFITDSPFIYLEKTILLAKRMLETLWGFTELHSQYKVMDLKESYFTVVRIEPRPPNQPMPNQMTDTTSQRNSGRGYDDNTLTPSRPLVKNRGGTRDEEMPKYIGYENPAHNPEPETYSYGSGDQRVAPSDVHEMTTYAAIDHQRKRPLAPPGGVALFPAQQQPLDIREPVYAQVNKNKGYNSGYDDNIHDLSHLQLDSYENTVTNADSWV